MDTGSSAAWAQTFIQGGALVILGYHLLFGLRTLMQDSQNTNQKNLEIVLKSKSDDVAQAAKAVSEIKEQLPLLCRYSGNDHI